MKDFNKLSVQILYEYTVRPKANNIWCRARQMNWFYLNWFFSLNYEQKMVTLAQKPECCACFMVYRSSILWTLASLAIQLNSKTFINCSMNISNQVVRIFGQWAYNSCCLPLIVCLLNFVEFSCLFQQKRILLAL